MATKNQRIFELDAMRGICILGMVIVHALFDMQDFFGITDFPGIYWFLLDWGGILFIVLSGLCVTLGHHPIRRGLIVFAAGMVCTGVTWAMAELGFASDSMIIRFGILHFLGICMLLSPILLKLPTWTLPFLAVAAVILGYGLDTVVLNDIRWLFPLGLRYPGFSSGDYFPLFPNIGYYIAGLFLGKTLYKKRESLFSKRVGDWKITRFFCFCGRHSLWIYLAHQPILYAIFYLI